jgi:hypothetical protein
MRRWMNLCHMLRVNRLLKLRQHQQELIGEKPARE